MDIRNFSAKLRPTRIMFNKTILTIEIEDTDMK